MSTPIVSIIVPVYNTEKYIESALKSCMKQTYTNIETIVVNDGSTDSSLSIINDIVATKHDHSVKVITTENKGLSAARNEGMKHASGEYICFLDSDDILDDSLVEKCMDVIQKHRLDLVTFDSLAICDGSYREFESMIFGLIRISKLLHNRIYSGVEFAKAEMMIDGISVSAWQSFYSKRFLDRNNIRFLEQAFYEDNAFHFSCLSMANRVMYLPEILYKHRVREESIMESALDIEKIRSLFMIADDITEQLEKKQMLYESAATLCEYAEHLVSGLIRVIERQIWYGNYNIITENREEISCSIVNTLDRLLTVYKHVYKDDVPIDKGLDLLYKFAHCFDMHTESMRGLEKELIRDTYYISLKATDVFYRPGLKLGLYGCGKHSEFLFSIIERIRKEDPSYFANDYVFLDSNMKSFEVSFLGHDVINIRDAYNEGVDAIVVFSQLYEEELALLARTYASNIPVYHLDGSFSKRRDEEKRLKFYIADKDNSYKNGGYLENIYQKQLRRFPQDVPKKKRVFLLSTPCHDNIGDYAITIAEREFFKKHFPETRLIAVDETRLLNERGYFFDEIRVNDIVVVTGGGFVGFWDHRNNVETILNKCRRNKIIFFPQSAFFGEKAYMKKMQGINNAISKCHDVTFIAREKNTFDYLNKYAPDNLKVVLAPDIALSLGAFDFKKNRGGIGVFLRKDKESAISKGDREMVVHLLKKKHQQVIESSMHYGNTISSELEQSIVYSKLSEIAGYKLVVTDTLHCMIFCALTGTPCIAVNNLTGKVEGVYEWINHLSYLMFFEDVDHLIEKIDFIGAANMNSGDYRFDYVPYEEMIKRLVAIDE